MGIEIKITPEMKARFAAEAAEHLDSFERMLLGLESGPFDPDLVHTAFRAIHSIKGNSDYIGVRDINQLSNALEDLLDELRKEQTGISSETIAVLFDGLDALRRMNRNITRADYREMDITELLEKIGDLKKAIPDTTAKRKSPRRSVDVLNVFSKTSDQHIQYLNRLADDVVAGQRSQKIKDNALRILQRFHISANYAGFDTIAESIKTLETRLAGMKTFGKRFADELKENLEAIGAAIEEARRASAVPETTREMAESVSAELSEADMRLSPGASTT